MTSDTERIIEKIKALLALAADPGAAQQEAETAARQAQKLMDKHSLDEYDLMVASGADWDLITGEGIGTRPGKKNAKVVPPWIGIIGFGVRVFCGVRSTIGFNRVFFKGRRSDVELAVWLHDLLVAGCYRASEGQPDPNAFRNGYAATIQSRLKALVKARETGGTASTAMVVINTRLEEAMNEAFGAPGRAVSKKVSQSGAGRAAGSNAHIPTARPVSNQGGHLRLK